MLWLILLIINQFINALVILIDKLILKTSLIQPKTYAFWVGVLSLSAFLLTPFGLRVISFNNFLLAILSGILGMLGLLAYYWALEKYEVSKASPAIGAALPIFIFFLNWWLLLKTLNISFLHILSLTLLIVGSVLIALKDFKSFPFRMLSLTTLTSLLMALSVVLLKKLYLEVGFISGFVWSRLGAFFVALCLLGTKEVKQNVLQKRRQFFSSFKQQGLVKYVILNQILGVSTAFLYNFAAYLVPVAYLPFINAFDGIKYIFLLMVVALLSKRFPRILIEEVVGKTFYRKIIAVILIAIGIALLYFNK